MKRGEFQSLINMKKISIDGFLTIHNTMNTTMTTEYKNNLINTFKEKIKSLEFKTIF